MAYDKKDAQVLIRHKHHGFTTTVPASLWDAHDDAFKADWHVLSLEITDNKLVVGTDKGKWRVEQPNTPVPAADPVAPPADAPSEEA